MDALDHKAMLNSEPPSDLKSGPSNDASSTPMTKANQAMRPEVVSREHFQSKKLAEVAYFADERAIILNMDVQDGLAVLEELGIFANCIVTSPPFYGQRDYEVENQIGLEDHPSQFIEALGNTFSKAKNVLADNGSLWVNIGDTYWSGKGQHRSSEPKQSARRFGLRPQDKKGDGLWCKPKQLLLIPHRLAIRLQDDGWLVRNDNVWIKPNPIPDQVRDRCSISHEYVFHFVKQRWYYFDKSKVGRTSERGSTLPPLDTWTVPPANGSAGSHRARFSEELVKVPILATTPTNGVVLDPFAGSGTSLIFALRNGFRAIGIDAKREYCDLMVEQLGALDD